MAPEGLKVKSWAVLAAPAIMGVALAAEEKLPMEKVPAAVTKAVKAKFPGATLERAEKEVENGKTLYEIEIKADHISMTVSTAEDGTILEIEKEMSAADLPAAVRAAAKAKYPNGTIKKVEEVTKGEKVTFELLMTREGEQPRELTLDKEGKLLEDEKAEDDD